MLPTTITIIVVGRHVWYFLRRPTNINMYNATSYHGDECPLSREIRTSFLLLCTFANQTISLSSHKKNNNQEPPVSVLAGYAHVGGSAGHVRGWPNWYESSHRYSRTECSAKP